MKAVLRKAYGGPEALRLEDVPVPVPGPGEVRVRVRAASINALDAHGLLGRPTFARLFTGLARPTDPRIGVDVAGEVEAVGSEVEAFAAGDAVFGACRGAFAEFACAAADKLAAKPAGVSFEQAAALPVAGLTALQGLRDAGRLQPGEKVLVIGAGGGVGSFAVAIARARGAEVTAVCGPTHVERVRGLGATRVVDYSREDVGAGGARYDLIYDLAGNRRYGALRRLLTREGRIVAAGIGAVGVPGLGWASGVVAGLLRARFGRRKMALCMARVRSQDLATLAAMVEAGDLTPPVTERFKLQEAPEAMRSFLAGKAGGKILLLP